MNSQFVAVTQWLIASLFSNNAVSVRFSTNFELFQANAPALTHFREVLFAVIRILDKGGMLFLSLTPVLRIQ